MSSTEAAILEALATYHYLTVDQLQRIGVSKNVRHIRQVLADMGGRKSKDGRKRKVPSRDGPPLISWFEYGREGGRIYLYWYLTPAGGEHTGVDVPVRPEPFKSTHLHRRCVVDLHIAVQQWAEQNGHEVDFFLTDFWDNPKIEGIKPDAVFRLTDTLESSRLFAAEVYCDRDAGRPVRNIARYLRRLDDDVIEAKFQHRHGAARILVLFKEPIEATVRKRLRLGDLAPFFYFRSLPPEGSMGDFRDGWHNHRGELVALFPYTSHAATAPDNASVS